MKKLNLLLMFAAVALLFSCSGDGDKEGEGEEEVKSEKIQDFVKPIAEFMNATDGVQLMSFFSSDKYNDKMVTLSATARTTGSSGKNGAIFVKEFTVEGVEFAPFVVVSDADKKKVADALDKLEKEGKEEAIKFVFKGKLVKKGSYESPFGHVIKLKFENGEVVSVG